MFPYQQFLRAGDFLSDFIHSKCGSWISADVHLILAISSCFICFLPAILGWDFIAPLQPDEDSVIAIRESRDLVMLLALCFGIAIPLLVQTMVNVVLSLKPISSLRSPFLILVLSLFVCDILMIAVALPNANMPLIVCLTDCRYIFVTYGVLGYVRNSGIPIFRSIFVVVSSVCLHASMVIWCLERFTSEGELSILNLVSNILTYIGVTSLLYISFKWLKKLYTSGFKNMSMTDAECSGYLIFYMLGLIAIIVIASLFEVRSINFIKYTTVIHALFTILVSILHRTIDQITLQTANKVRSRILNICLV